MRIQAVIFDRDQTLLYFDADQMARIEARTAEIAPALPPRALALAWQAWPGPWPQHHDAEPAFWRDFWGSLGQAHSLSVAQIETLLAEIGTLYHTCFAAYPDAVSVVNHLHNAGLRLAVLTNFELPSVDRTLAHAGLNPALFAATLSSAALGLYKPDPRAFLAAAAALDLAPQACAVVDDLAENVAAARSIGMLAYQIDRALLGDDLATMRINTLNSLIGLLLPPSARD